MKILSLGWGVQSFTLAAMSALGDIEHVDFAIHADTNHESALTYAFRGRWTKWLESMGVSVVVVMATHEKKNIIDKWGGMQLPAFTASAKGEGQIRRQCTYEWKIRPMRQWMQANRDGQPIEQWIGISTDESLRIRPSGVKYITNRWPLIEMNMSRRDCINYLENNGLEVPTKSACVFCPYHTAAEWRVTKEILQDWQEAIRVDAFIRHARPPQDLFIHPSRKPLMLVDLRTQEQKGQMRFEGWDAECSGLCGV